MSMSEAHAPRDEPAHNVLAAEVFGVPAADPVLHEAHEAAHDVLAAEVFGVPAADPVLHEAHEAAHDVLAAEVFGVLAADPALHHGSGLPATQAGGPERHHEPAAEQCRAPGSLHPRAGGALTRGTDCAARWVAGAAALGAVALWLRRRR